MTHTRVIDLYGILEESMEQAASILTQAIGLDFQGRSSELWGDHYSARSADRQDVFDLKENFNQVEGELTWPQHHTYPLILEGGVESVARAHEIEKCILQVFRSKAILLDRIEYPVTDEINRP